MRRHHESFPILERRGPGPAIIEPSRLHARRPKIPERCVLCFFLDELKARAARGELEPIASLRSEGEPITVYRAGESDGAVAVAWPGLGAPLASVTLEELIALGGRAFIGAGGAGVLDGSIPVGQVLLPTAALRDEGTSYHYQRRGRYSRPHPAAVRAIREACRALGQRALAVQTWTTDAVFRETRDVIARRRAEGCLAVEMEAAAFFAVARFRGVILGQVLYAGDDVGGETWQHRGWTSQAAARAGLLDLALEACRRLPRSAA
jgi:uridine phosphorylase